MVIITSFLVIIEYKFRKLFTKEQHFLHIDAIKLVFNQISFCILQIFTIFAENFARVYTRIHRRQTQTYKINHTKLWRINLKS